MHSVGAVSRTGSLVSEHSGKSLCCQTEAITGVDFVLLISD